MIYITYIILWGVVLVLSHVVALALSTVLLLGNQTGTRYKARPAIIPEFTLPGLGTGESISRKTLLGDKVTLLFLNPATTPVRASRRELLASCRWRIRNAEGRIYIVCSGQEAVCTELCQQGLGKTTVPIILDEQGELARSLRIEETPSVVKFDADGRFVQYGHMVPSSDVEPWFHPRQ